MSFDGTLAATSWSPPALLNEEMLLSKREQHMHMIEQFSQQDVATPPRTPDTATVSRSSSFSSLSALSAPPSIMNRSTSFHGISSSSADASALSLFSQRGGASCLVQQLSLSRTMAAGTQQDFVSQIAMGLKSDSSEDRDNACSALVNICSKDGLSQFVVDIALSHLAVVVLMPESAKKPVLRHAAIVFERLSENRDVALQMLNEPAVSDAILHLIRAPLACIWRNALRAALLLSYYSPTSFAPLLLRASVFPQIVKMLNSDQLEMRFDSIRGVRGLSLAPGGCESLLQQHEIIVWLCRTCLTTVLPIEFEHIASTIAVLLASAPDVRPFLLSCVASSAVQLGQWKPLRQTTVTLVSMVQELLTDAEALIQQQQQSTSDTNHE